MIYCTQTVILLFLLSISHQLKDHEIGQRSVLLPIDYGATHRVQHLMEAFGGCYSWTANQPHVLRIQTLSSNSDCSSRALVQVQKEGPFFGPLTISATDRQTGQVIKAVVRLAKLHRIQILTKFRIMNLYQVQEFYLIGYDELGNSFSSLEGLKFQWTLDQHARVGEKITIRESNIFQQTNYRRGLQETGYETDMLVIKALNIGEIQLTVRLNEPNYEHIYTSIRLSVQERFDIIPSSPVYMISGSKVRFNLLNIKGQTIKLPTSYYQYSLDQNFKIADDLVITSPTFETNGKLIVKDTRTQPPYANQVDIYNLHPDSIEVEARSYVIVGEATSFKINLFNNRRLLKGGVPVQIDSDFYLNRQNSSFQASSKGTGTIKVSYQGLTHEKRIIANLRLRPVLIGNKIVLPPGQTFELKILGGSGSYDFSLIDSHDIAFINHNGIISAKSQGKARVIVVDNNDHNNKIEIDLVVDNVKAIRSFDQKLEAGIGNEITVLAIVQPEHQRQYTQCNEILISIFQNDLIQSNNGKEDTLETIIKIHHNAQTNPELSTVLEIFRQGRNFNLNEYRDHIIHEEISLSQLEKLLFIQDNFGICKAIKAKPLVAREGEAHFQIRGHKDYVSTPFKVKVYDELGIVDQTSTRILLVPGSNFIWKTEQNGAEDSLYYLNDIKTKDGDSIVLTCSRPGQIKDYSIKVVHQISQRLPRPYIRHIKVTIECLEPSALKFKVNNNIIENGQLYIANDEPFIAQIRGFDHLGRQFYNISTLDLNWNLDGLKRNQVSPKDNLYRFSFTGDAVHPHINVKTSGSKYYGINFPQIQTNLDVIRAKQFRLLFKGRPLAQTLTLVATPNHIHIINIVDGSNNFEVKCPNPELLKCHLNSNLKTIQVTPMKKGNTKLLVIDLQQYGRPTLEIDVKIVNPVRLRIRSNASLVEEGSAFKLQYFVYGEDDLLIDHAQYDLLNIIPRYNCQLQKIDSKTFRALKKGHCSISGSLPQYSLSSENIVEIQVFPKFSINVPNVQQVQRNGIKYYTGEVRIPYGCESTLMFLGGPFGVGKLSYETDPSNILDIEELNLRTFKLIGRKKGSTDLKFVLKDGEQEISIISIKAIVKEIGSVQLINANRQIHEKATVRIIPEILIDDQVVLNSRCPIKFQWKTNNADVLSIKGWNSVDAQDNFGLNITGLKRGYAKIQMIPISHLKSLSKQQFIVEVIQTPVIDLATYIHHGKTHPTSLLIPPNSGYSLNSSYQVEIVSPCEQLMRVVGNDIETFNDKGGSVVKLKTLNRDHSVTYMSINVERIHSVFIQNPMSKLSLQMDTEVRVPFYVQDSFGRLFPNNLKSIEYEVRVSNPSIVNAQISEDKQYIILRGFNAGLAELYLSIAGQPDIYDVIPIQAMVLITPISPVIAHVGGNIQFKSVKSGLGQWTSENPFVLQIDRQSGKALALRQGSTQISYSQGIQYKARVNIYKASDIVIKDTKELLTNYKGEEHYLSLIVLADKGAGTVELTELNRPLWPINNNLVVKCSPKYPLWFEVQCSIRDINDKEQAIYAYPKALKVYPQKEQMPKQLQFQVRLESGTIGEVFLIREIVYPFFFEFKISNPDKYIGLGAREKTKDLEIQTNSKLGVYSEYSKGSWLNTQFIPERSLQIVKLDFRQQTDSVKTSIRIMNHITKQSEQITVNFNPATSFSSKGFGSEWFGQRWSWTSWIIIFMSLVILMLFICACCNREYVFYPSKDD